MLSLALKKPPAHWRRSDVSGQSVVQPEVGVGEQRPKTLHPGWEVCSSEEACLGWHLRTCRDLPAAGLPDTLCPRAGSQGYKCFRPFLLRISSGLPLLQRYFPGLQSSRLMGRPQRFRFQEKLFSLTWALWGQSPHTKKGKWFDKDTIMTREFWEIWLLLLQIRKLSNNLVRAFSKYTE